MLEGEKFLCYLFKHKTTTRSEGTNSDLLKSELPLSLPSPSVYFFLLTQLSAFWRKWRWKFTVLHGSPILLGALKILKPKESWLEAVYNSSSRSRGKSPEAVGLEVLKSILLKRQKWKSVWQHVKANLPGNIQTSQFTYVWSNFQSLDLKYFFSLL